MDANIDLTKILKDCPAGTVFWSDNYGEVKLLDIDTDLSYPIRVRCTDGSSATYTKEGWCRKKFPASCLLWPSWDCRDWSKFKAPWRKMDKFDPKTLKPFEKVLVRDRDDNTWKCEFFSHIGNEYNCFPCITIASCYRCCIPYNDETKQLVGTTNEAPEYYRYWDDPIMDIINLT